jgi:hypothetical protein
LPTSCKALQRYDEPYNDLRNRYNDSLENIDLSENSQVITNVLQIVQRFGESYNDSRNHYNDSLCKGIIVLLQGILIIPHLYTTNPKR